MQNDFVSELLAHDHARLVSRLAARPMDAIILAQLEHRSRLRGMVLAGAAILGTAIASLALVALVPMGPIELSPAGLSFMLGSLVIAGTIGALGRTMAD